MYTEKRRFGKMRMTHKIIIKKLRKISKFRRRTNTRVDAKTAYLFLLTQPTKNMQKEKHIDNIVINKRLYSISQMAKLGPQIKFIQNK